MSVCESEVIKWFYTKVTKETSHLFKVNTGIKVNRGLKSHHHTGHWNIETTQIPFIN